MNVWGEGVRGKPLYLPLNFSVNLKTAIKNKVFNFLKVCIIIRMFCFIMTFSQNLCKVVAFIQIIFLHMRKVMLRYVKLLPQDPRGNKWCSLEWNLSLTPNLCFFLLYQESANYSL